MGPQYFRLLVRFQMGFANAHEFNLPFGLAFSSAIRLHLYSEVLLGFIQLRLGTIELLMYIFGCYEIHFKLSENFDVGTFTLVYLQSKYV